MRFTSKPFTRSNGRGPRGDGTWAFQASRSDVAFDRDLVGEVVFVSGPFAEARQEAVRALKAAQPAVAATAPFLAVLP